MAAVAFEHEQRTTRSRHLELNGRVRDLFLRYLIAVCSDGTAISVVERDENTDKIIRIRTHPELEERVILHVLVSFFRTLTEGERRAWCAVEFGIVFVKVDGGDQARLWKPEALATDDMPLGMLPADAAWFYGSTPHSIESLLSKARGKMRGALEDERVAASLAGMRGTGIAALLNRARGNRR